MTSFQLTLSPSRRAAARFVTAVRRALLKALSEELQERGLTQSEIARVIGVHRSVINRELRGQKDITLSRVAELAYAMGRAPTFTLPALDDEFAKSNMRREKSEDDVATGSIMYSRSIALSPSRPLVRTQVAS